MTVQIPWVKPFFDEQDENAVAQAVRSSWISGGPFVEKLEQSFRDLFQTTDAIAVSNGTTAIHLALLGLGIGPGDEVIVPNYGFVAAANMVRMVGATVVPCEVDDDDWCVTLAGIEKLCTNRTRALIAIHTYGISCDLEQMSRLCKLKSIAFIEDAAESLFSRQAGSLHGTVGDIGTFSFHATKTITTGEGGLVICKDSLLAQKMRMIRDHGMEKTKRYWHPVVGHNFRMTNIQAALGCSQYSKKDFFIQERKKLFSLYSEKLGSLGKIQTLKDSDDPVMWAMGLRLPEKNGGLFRESLIQKMLSDGIELRPGFYPLSVMPPFKNSSHTTDLKHSEKLASEIIALPFYIGLQKKDVDLVVSTLKKHLSA